MMQDQFEAWVVLGTNQAHLEAAVFERSRSGSERDELKEYWRGQYGRGVDFAQMTREEAEAVTAEAEAILAWKRYRENV
jgi:hypothetical protein